MHTLNYETERSDVSNHLVSRVREAGGVLHDVKWRHRLVKSANCWSEGANGEKSKAIMSMADLLMGKT